MSSATLEALSHTLQEHLGDRVKSLKVALGEVTVEVDAADYLAVMQTLRDEPALSFEELIDLCGVDYSTYANAPRAGRRFAAVSHLISITRNWRLRVRCFAPDDDFPSVPSVTGVWNVADWFEREAFDLFGIVFPGHLDLRRILTDYGFIGHPFRKDFPISGYVEMRYDPDQQRVIYQPVTIEPREVTPRIVREATYGNVENA
ncbi:NADH-quinone oxidoreductase subunit C [Accumulibacter sp.]|mgnify:FL=1|jgi:NADH-quinone oxidoreductase subunit C|uniref:NADH-quinone oxidoreductase subunit C n=1 Tax=Accumulibacter regalis TaxID=522306 RepID=C7RL80_ACCRE|nr:NADH-quinone oxidoreductase subunit C [Accumulibacter sp.]MBN8498459.1 NADH-quinone oxidoreductase subunit C [Accumulibacter sp.]MBO3716982.1 NADH-quinone oxidoreductase subunit C [Accumulibacter sp.]